MYSTLLSFPMRGATLVFQMSSESAILHLNAQALAGQAPEVVQVGLGSAVRSLVGVVVQHHSTTPTSRVRTLTPLLASSAYVNAMKISARLG